MAAALPAAAGAGAGRLPFVPMETISETGNEAAGAVQAAVRRSAVSERAAEVAGRLARIASAITQARRVKNASAAEVLLASATVRAAKEKELTEARAAKETRTRRAVRAEIAKENVVAAIANLAQLTIDNPVRGNDEKNDEKEQPPAAAAAAKQPSSSMLSGDDITLADIEMKLKGITTDFAQFLTKREFYQYAPFDKRNLEAENRLTKLGCPIQCEQLNRKCYLAVFEWYKKLYDYECLQANYKFWTEDFQSSRFQNSWEYDWEESQAARKRGMSLAQYKEHTCAAALASKNQALVELKADLSVAQQGADEEFRKLNAEIERIKAIYDDSCWKEVVASVSLGAGPAAAAIPEGIELSPEGYDLRRANNTLESLANLFAQIKVKYGKAIESGEIKELTFYTEGCPYLERLLSRSVLMSLREDTPSFSSLPDSEFRKDAVVQLLAIFYGTPVDVAIRVFCTTEETHHAKPMGFLRIKKLYRANTGGAFQGFEWRHTGSGKTFHRGYLTPAVEKGASDNDAPNKDEKEPN